MLRPALFALGLSLAGPANAAPATFDHIAPGAIGDLLARLEQPSVVKKTRQGTPIHVLRFDKVKAMLRGLLCDAGNCRLLRLSAIFSGTEVPLEKLNAWNAEHRFSRAYRDSDGDVQLVSDLDLDGGVNDHDARLFLDVFGDQAGDFLQVLR